uniref:NADH-ubiquinone oxidoreductase chain 6 n=1 Tax=Scolytinae sp. BMNH 1040319 TaxID=1903789 RepID=A0A343A577_9CUCU|nr:NADH dehydrogenase subunit 6 [Scolytinae sp. BMNH 1040319]
MTILIMNSMFSTLFMFLNHPLSLGSILLIQSILTAVLSGLIFINFWLSYILFLIMVGGMLIMFMYMTSIASNEKFKMPKTMMMIMLIITMLTAMMIMLNLSDSSILPMNSEMINMKLSKNFMNLSLNKFFNWPNFMMLIMIMTYLLITLIAIVKITKSKMGPMRQK